MVAQHGGRPTDYEVTQATITPYIITCLNTMIRDMIVRGGIYSIPQTQIRFTVHEWRPRFGMSYNPPSHQVWVRIVGLPLQAWTQSEETAFLQNFGHPIDILPFVAAAGHFTDITALVNSKHPSHIPLAYTYRESDYSVQVDIHILAWREWENSYFPPPNNPLPQQNHPIHSQQQNDPTIVVNHSSSSSSNAAPSESTIDHSSWSPRSYHLGGDLNRNWKIKPPIEPSKNLSIGSPKGLNLCTALFHPSTLATPSPADGSNQLLELTQENLPTLATRDPNLTDYPINFFLLICLNALSCLPNPIKFNALRDIMTAECYTFTLIHARQYPVTVSHLNISIVHNSYGQRYLRRETLEHPAESICLCPKNREYHILWTKQRESPLQPKPLNYSTQIIPIRQAQIQVQLRGHFPSQVSPLPPNIAHDNYIPFGLPSLSPRNLIAACEQLEETQNEYPEADLCLSAPIVREILSIPHCNGSTTHLGETIMQKDLSPLSQAEMIQSSP